MPQPIICLDEEVCHFAERFRSVFSKPQYQYFVTVLLGLLECDGKALVHVTSVPLQRSGGQQARARAAHIDQHDLVGGETFGHLFRRQVADRTPTEQSVHQMPLTDDWNSPNVAV